ncbi:MAG: hypothetical protein ACK47B_00050 [Armatimonadota bacterium]
MPAEDPRAEAERYYQEARARGLEGNVTGALPRYLRALALLEGLDEAAWRAEIAFEIAAMNQECGDSGEARRWYAEARRQFRELGDRSRAAAVVFRQAQVEQGRGDMPAAEALFREAEAACAELDDLAGAARARAALGLLLWELGREEEAVALALASLAELRRLDPAAARPVREAVRAWSERIGRVRYRRLLQAAGAGPELLTDLME